MDLYYTGSNHSPSVNGSRSSFADVATKGFPRQPSVRSEKQQHSVTFQVKAAFSYVRKQVDILYNIALPSGNTDTEQTGLRSVSHSG